MTSSPSTTLAGRNSIASRVMVFFRGQKKTLAFRQIDRQDRIIEQKRKNFRKAPRQATGACARSRGSATGACARSRSFTLCGVALSIHESGGNTNFVCRKIAEKSRIFLSHGFAIPCFHGILIILVKWRYLTLRIMHVMGGGDVGGAKTQIMNTVTGLNRNNDVMLISFRAGPFAG